MDWLSGKSSRSSAALPDVGGIVSGSSVSATADHHYYPVVVSAPRSPSGCLHFLFTATLAPIARNQLAAMHRKGVTFDRAPLVMTVAAERLRRLFRLTKGEYFSHGSVSHRLWRGESPAAKMPAAYVAEKSPSSRERSDQRAIPWPARRCLARYPHPSPPGNTRRQPSFR